MMKRDHPSEAEIQAALEHAYSLMGLSYVPSADFYEPLAGYLPDGKPDWTHELARARELLGTLPHRCSPGTPGTYAAGHFIATGHRLDHGCCSGQIAC